MKKRKPSPPVKVPIMRREAYPVFMIDPREGDAQVEMTEAEYKRYKDAAREWYAVQAWLGELYLAEEAAGRLRHQWTKTEE